MSEAEPKVEVTYEWPQVRVVSTYRYPDVSAEFKRELAIVAMFVSVLETLDSERARRVLLYVADAAGVNL